MATMLAGRVPAPSFISCAATLARGANVARRLHSRARRSRTGSRHRPGPAANAASPEGQLTWGVHISLAPTWFDPAETPGMITPFMVMYALHDAVVKPMPGKPVAPSLAKSWTVSPDGLTYEFVLRKGVKFHNGDRSRPMT